MLWQCARSTRRYRHIHGELSGRQIDWVGRLLQEAPIESPKLVVCHQPLYVKKLLFSLYNFATLPTAPAQHRHCMARYHRGKTYCGSFPVR